ncbi:hypothetical protein CFOL_v3_21306 [Cephalotus follicularis]|uniref:Uncharacterized protein n=1 Tax=Cephalotus follicularis TaxID=3775 RepID=A0A1Q3CC86_CEPFO|nr:hypothetical protein CFOL_v3_21306 [Cephalotus follicularis]
MSTLNTRLPPITKASIPKPEITQLRSPSKSSPVPYLFGGLAAMLGLIAFALFILGCSYWKLSTRGEGGNERDLESNGNEKEGDSVKPVKVYEDNILVIMAGHEKPTFLATPTSSKASSFGDTSGNKIDSKGGKVENSDQVKEEMPTEENRETQDTQQGPLQVE